MISELTPPLFIPPKESGVQKLHTPPTGAGCKTLHPIFGFHQWQKFFCCEIANDRRKLTSMECEVTSAKLFPPTSAITAKTRDAIENYRELSGSKLGEKNFRRYLCGGKWQSAKN
ncbi:hypothetical protein CEXT_707001 [Caerostris extrusa]|uniref:Uncharacterized protein n=1 Tax=Caerostris extrusa TaxID=172846 RepID=A0AAV4YCP3_CAEEX|nr:hypothetical protein CEXT_707001 [Caerostris extrusa]